SPLLLLPARPMILVPLPGSGTPWSAFRRQGLGPGEMIAGVRGLVCQGDTPLTVSLSHSLTVSLSHCLTLSLSHSLTVSLPHSLTVSLSRIPPAKYILPDPDG